MKFTDYDIKSAYTKLGFYARKLTLGNLIEAEDLLHDTILKLLENEDVYDSRKSLEKWGSSVMHNLYVDRCRSRALRGWPIHTGDIGHFDYPDSVESVPRAVATQVMYREVKRALKECERTQKYIPVFLLRGMGCSSKEIAGILETTVPTVKNRLHEMRADIATLYPKGVHYTDFELV